MLLFRQTIWISSGEKETATILGESLLAIAGKILGKDLLKRLTTTIIEPVFPESQCGFRANHGTTDMIFCARQILEKSREQHKDLYMVFIGLTKAFDSIN